MSNVGFFDEARDRLRNRIEEFSHRWGWYFALGLFLVCLGTIATGVSVATTLISVITLGWILIAAGAGLIVLSFLTGQWSGFMLSLAAGILSGITGIMLLRDPLSGAATITLMIATLLVVAGIYRSVSSIVMRFPNWGWSLVSGLVSLVLGVTLIAGWPAVSLWFIGLYVGVDLILHGFAWMMFSYRVHDLTRTLERTTDTVKRAA